MLLPDTNVLLYATSEPAEHHEAARTWLDDALGGAEPVAFVWLVLTAFVRIATHPGVYPRPLSTGQALDVVGEWLAQPAAVVLEPGPDHVSTLRALLTATGTGGNLVNDAHVAALAREHGATVVSYDNDFSRFTGVRWTTP